MPDIFSRAFKLLPAKEIIAILKKGSAPLDRYLGEEIYVNTDRGYLGEQRARLLKTMELHLKNFGNVPSLLLRAPGRLNAFLEYLDMCGGDHMSTTIDGDIPMALSFRDDNRLELFNSNPLFPRASLSLRDELRRFNTAPWKDRALKGMADNWDNRTLLFPYHGRKQGDWVNYVLSPYLKMLWENPKLDIRGADITFGPATTPFRAGVSSSSAMVVLSFLAMYFRNRDILPKMTESDVCRFLGEAEWYVGTHGGANDQMTILFNRVNSVSYNRHSRKELGSTPLPFIKGVHVVLANSLWEVNKSTGGNQSFNMRKGWIRLGEELADMLVAKASSVAGSGKARKGWLASLVEELFNTPPEKPCGTLEKNPRLWLKLKENFKRFGSLHEDIIGLPEEVIEEFISLLPVKVLPAEAAEILGADIATVIQRYTAPKRKIGGYHLRTTARFFHKQNIIGRRLEKIFLDADTRLKSGKLRVDSKEYDAYRVEVGRMVDELQDALSFDFRVSIPQIDLLLSIAKRGPGYLGGKLTGAGKGGCVSLLVREEHSKEMCRHLDKEYYGRPENFEYYRMVLKDEIRFLDPGSVEHDSAIERLGNLEKALASVKDQRRAVTFSRGACAIDMIR